MKKVDQISFLKSAGFYRGHTKMRKPSVRKLRKLLCVNFLCVKCVNFIFFTHRMFTQFTHRIKNLRTGSLRNLRTEYKIYALHLIEMRIKI